MLAHLKVRSLAEPDNLVYDAHQSRSDENILILLEGYKDEAALFEHRASEHYRTLVTEGIIPLLKDREITCKIVETYRVFIYVVATTVLFHPNVKAFTSAPASRNSISNWMSVMSPDCRISWYIRGEETVPYPCSSTSIPCDGPGGFPLRSTRYLTGDPAFVAPITR